MSKSLSSNSEDESFLSNLSEEEKKISQPLLHLQKLSLSKYLSTKTEWAQEDQNYTGLNITEWWFMIQKRKLLVVQES